MLLGKYACTHACIAVSASAAASISSPTSSALAACVRVGVQLVLQCECCKRQSVCTVLHRACCISASSVVQLYYLTRYGVHIQIIRIVSSTTLDACHRLRLLSSKLAEVALRMIQVTAYAVY
jgi:hypothetical protein